MRDSPAAADREVDLVVDRGQVPRPRQRLSAGCRSERTSATTTSGTSARPAARAITSLRSSARTGELRPPACEAAAERGDEQKRSTPRAGSTPGSRASRSGRTPPDETVEPGLDPSTRRNAPNHVASSPASGSERRATAIAPAIGAHSSRRALQKNSRRLPALSSQARPVDLEMTPRTPAPCRGRVASRARASAARRSRARANGSSGRSFRASRAATAGAARKSPFDGSTPTAKPITSPAAAASRSARRLERAHEEVGADEEEHHRLVVGEPGQTKCGGRNCST